ncbi:MAG: PAS domain-containing protein [Brasilonema sp.]
MSASVLRILNQPGWNYKLSHEGVSIFAPTKQDATYFAQSYGAALTETAVKIKGKVRIGWRGCKQPIEFYGWMTSQEVSTAAETAHRFLPVRNAVFCSQVHLPIELLCRMVAAAENKRPVSIVRQDNHKQIIINKPMSDMLQTSPEIVTQRVMTRFWLPGDLAELEQRLRNKTRFTWTYCGRLNDQTWAILTTEFEAFEVKGIWYRQGTCLATPQPVPIPPGAFAPV